MERSDLRQVALFALGVITGAVAVSLFKKQTSVYDNRHASNGSSMDLSSEEYNTLKQ